MFDKGRLPSSNQRKWRPPLSPSYEYIFSVHFHNSSNCFWFFSLWNLGLLCFSIRESRATHLHSLHCISWRCQSKLSSLHRVHQYLSTLTTTYFHMNLANRAISYMFCKVRSFLSSTFFNLAPLSTKRDSYIVLDIYCKD